MSPKQLSKLAHELELSKATLRRCLDINFPRTEIRRSVSLHKKVRQGIAHLYKARALLPSLESEIDKLIRSAEVRARVIAPRRTRLLQEGNVSARSDHYGKFEHTLDAILRKNGVTTQKARAMKIEKILAARGINTTWRGIVQRLQQR